MDRFYLMESIPDNNRKKLAENSEIVQYDPEELLRGKVHLQNPVFTAKKGFQKFDFLETEMPSMVLFSEKVFQALQTNNIIGWGNQPVKVYEKGSDNYFTYHLLFVMKASSSFNYAASEVISKEYGFVALKGRYFDDVDVKDVDIFVVPKTVMKFVNKRFKEVAEKEKFTNVAFTPNDEFISSIPNNVYQQGLKP